MDDDLSVGDSYRDQAAFIVSTPFCRHTQKKHVTCQIRFNQNHIPIFLLFLFGLMWQWSNPPRHPLVCIVFS